MGSAGNDKISAVDQVTACSQQHRAACPRNEGSIDRRRVIRHAIAHSTEVFDVYNQTRTESYVATGVNTEDAC
jgi:hypothetical protein